MKGIQPRMTSAKGGKMIRPEQQAKFAADTFDVAKEVVKRTEEAPKSVQEFATAVQDIKRPIYEEYMAEAQKA